MPHVACVAGHGQPPTPEGAYVPYVTPLSPGDPPPTVMNDLVGGTNRPSAQPAATPAATEFAAPESSFYSTAGRLSIVKPTTMLEEDPPQSPVGRLASLDTPVRGEGGGAPPTLPLAPARGPARGELSNSLPSPPAPALPPQLSHQPLSHPPQQPLFHRDECPVP